MKRRKIVKIKNIILNFVKKCPLATMLVVSVVGLSFAGSILSLSKGEKISVTAERPLFASIIAPQKGQYDEDLEGEEDLDDEEDEGGSLTDSAEGTEGTANRSEADQVNNTATNGQSVSDPANGVYLKVKKKYFDDALFIGDSRVEGLKLYSGLDNATFYCKEGVSLTKILKDKFVKMKIDGKKKNVSITKALKKKKFGKIYLMVGINEVGYRDTDEFKEIYKTTVDKIKELQPEAKIIILGMMKVTKDYAKENPSFSNKNISNKNKAIASLADNVNVFYLDFNSEICDSKGNVKKKYTWDGVHLKAEYYSIWVDFMKEHGI